MLAPPLLSPFLFLVLWSLTSGLSPPASSPHRILLFGDSLTAGQIAERGGFEPPGRRLAQHLDDSAVVQVEGVPLESVHAMPSRLEEVLKIAAPDKKFDFVVVMGGTNDLWRLNATDICESLNRCFEAALRHNGDVRYGYVTLPQFTPAVVSWATSLLERGQSLLTGGGGGGGSNYEEQLEECRKEINGAIAAEVAAQKVRRGAGESFIVDVALMCLQSPQVMARPDGIHFTSEGYQAIGDELFARLHALAMNEDDEGGNPTGMKMDSGAGKSQKVDGRGDNDACSGGSGGGGGGGGDGDDDGDDDGISRVAENNEGGRLDRKSRPNLTAASAAQVVAYRLSLATMAAGLVGSVASPLFLATAVADTAATSASSLALGGGASALLLADWSAAGGTLPLLEWPLGGASFRAAALLALLPIVRLLLDPTTEPLLAPLTSTSFSSLDGDESLAAAAATSVATASASCWALLTPTLLLCGREIRYFGAAFKIEAAAAAAAAVVACTAQTALAFAAWALCFAVLAAGKAFEPLRADLDATSSDFLVDKPLD